jgi:hypothetical protein
MLIILGIVLILIGYKLMKTWNEVKYQNELGVSTPTAGYERRLMILGYITIICYILGVILIVKGL